MNQLTNYKILEWQIIHLETKFTFHFFLLEELLRVGLLMSAAKSGNPEEQQQISIQQLCNKLLQMERENVDAHIIGGRSYIWGMQYNIQLNICRTQSHLLP